MALPRDGVVGPGTGGVVGAVRMLPGPSRGKAAPRWPPTPSAAWREAGGRPAQTPAVGGSWRVPKRHAKGLYDVITQRRGGFAAAGRSAPTPAWPLRPGSAGGMGSHPRGAARLRGPRWRGLQLCVTPTQDPLDRLPANHTGTPAGQASAG